MSGHWEDLLDEEDGDSAQEIARDAADPAKLQATMAEQLSPVREVLDKAELPGVLDDVARQIPGLKDLFDERDRLREQMDALTGQTSSAPEPDPRFAFLEGMREPLPRLDRAEDPTTSSSVRDPGRDRDRDATRDAFRSAGRDRASVMDTFFRAESLAQRDTARDAARDGTRDGVANAFADARRRMGAANRSRAWTRTRDLTPPERKRRHDSDKARQRSQERLAGRQHDRRNRRDRGAQWMQRAQLIGGLPAMDETSRRRTLGRLTLDALPTTWKDRDGRLDIGQLFERDNARDALRRRQAEARERARREEERKKAEARRKKRESRRGRKKKGR